MLPPNINVSIAAHYVPARVEFLARVLEGIAGWNRPSVSVTIVTNDLALADDPQLQEALEKVALCGYRAVFDRTHGMEHPFHLTWWHKRHLREWFTQEATPHDLFMYIEDDIVVTKQNLDYFERYLPFAKKAGRIPGFIRYENGGKGDAISTDFLGHQIVREEERIHLDGQAFVSPRFPYWAGFILDRELCAEYLSSPWSDMKQAEQLPEAHNHTCRVHSAWALTYLNVEPGLHSRYVVPVNDRLQPLPCCAVWHSAQNYSVSKPMAFGTVRLKDVFLNPGPLAKARQALWHVGKFMLRIRHKLRRDATRTAAAFRATSC